MEENKREYAELLNEKIEENAVATAQIFHDIFRDFQQKERY